MDGLVLVALLAFGVVLALLPGYWLFYYLFLILP